MKNKYNTIFSTKATKSYKLIPFHSVQNTIGTTKYLPPVSKEWKNNVYNYNDKNIINFPIFLYNINLLIKSYFNLAFRNSFLNTKQISFKKRRESLNKIFVSKAEIKHTNSKAIITIYVYNREKVILWKKKHLIREILKKFIPLYINFKNSKSILNSFYNLPWESTEFSLNKLDLNRNKLKLFNFRMKYFNKKMLRNLGIIRRLKLKFNLNQFKFQYKLLIKLGKLISQYLNNKKVIFNIVNLKYISLNNDIITEILTRKLKKNIHPMIAINSVLSKIKLPKVNEIRERSRIKKLLGNTFFNETMKNNNLINLLDNKFTLYKDPLNNLLETFLLQEETNNTYNNLRNILLDKIKYKNIGGIRVRVKGRLTKRYRADRAISKLKWKGGLKNIDSAFKGFSSVVYRGYLDANLEKSVLASKRRVGSYGVVSWLGSR